jgi:hypothetical protein
MFRICKYSTVRASPPPTFAYVGQLATAGPNFGVPFAKLIIMGQGERAPVHPLHARLPSVHRVQIGCLLSSLRSSHRKRIRKRQIPPWHRHIFFFPRSRHAMSRRLVNCYMHAFKAQERGHQREQSSRVSLPKPQKLRSSPYWKRKVKIFQNELPLREF